MKLSNVFMVVLIMGIIFVSGCSEDVPEIVVVEESCVGEGESLGAVVPGNDAECCEGLEVVVPEDLLGTRGTCELVGADMEETGHQIEMTAEGFSPSSLTIKAGDAVTFVNMNAQKHWPASDIHPSHTLYPGSSIGKCNSADKDKIFDACKGLEEGESYTFVFNEVGSWGYHDHLRSGIRGSIVVE